MLLPLLHTGRRSTDSVVALPQDCFELGVILLRKKLYTQATKNLEKASRMWDGEPEELAQVHTLCPVTINSHSCSFAERKMCGSQ